MTQKDTSEGLYRTTVTLDDGQDRTEYQLYVYVSPAIISSVDEDYDEGRITENST